MERISHPWAKNGENQSSKNGENQSSKNGENQSSMGAKEAHGLRKHDIEPAENQELRIK
jgi:hypothetical protein